MATDPEPARPVRQRPSARILLVLGAVAVSAYALDLLSKTLVLAHLPVGEPIEVLGRALILQHVKNPGAAFSLGAGTTWIFSIIAAVVAVVIVLVARRIRHLGWAVLFGMLLGGVLGNLTDRLFREPGFGVGHVVDFIYTPWMMPAIYNVADIFVVSSMVLFVLLTLLGVGLDGSREPRRRRESDLERHDSAGERS